MKKPVRKVRRYDQGGGVRPVDPSNVPIEPTDPPQIYQQSSNEGNLITSGIKMGLSMGGLSSLAGSSSSTSKRRGGPVKKVIKAKRKR